MEDDRKFVTLRSEVLQEGNYSGFEIVKRWSLGVRCILNPSVLYPENHFVGS